MFSDKPLIITGMHRSGTSLLADILRNAGVALGDNLMPAGEHNRKGHFEDKNFVEFHEGVILRVDPAKKFLWEPQGQIALSDDETRAARSLVDGRNLDVPWGWKDPRTVLFLDFWAQLLPEASFLFVFRSPGAVVDSLRRRGDKRLMKVLIGKNLWPGKGRLAFFRYQHAINAWALYNQRILDFVEKHPGRSCLVEIDGLLTESEQIFEYVKRHLEIPLRSIDLFRVYDPALMTKQPHPRVARALRKRPDVTRLYESLQSVAAKQTEKGLQ